MFVTSAKVTLILGSSKNFWRNLYSVVWDFRLLWLPLHPISYKLYPAMQKVFRRYTLCLLAILVLFSCKPERQHRGITDENQRTHVDSVIFDAFDTRDVPRTLAVIDSVERLGELSKVRGIFYRTITYNVRGSYGKSLSLYYQLADIKASDLDDQGDLECFNYTCKDYLRLLCHMKRYDVALREANAFDQKLREAGQDDFIRLHDIAEMIGECQLYLGQTDKAERSFQRALDDIHQMLKIHHAPLDFRESEHTMKSVAMAYIQSGYYDKAVPWVERQDSLFTIASNRSDRDTIYIDEMKADLCYCKMLLAHKRGALYAADEAYRDYLSTRTSKRLGHIINSTEYLMQTNRYSEAADHYELLQRYMDASAFEVDLENIGRYLFPKYRANLLAGRKDTALSVATQIAEAYDSALAQQKRSDAALLATVYDTEGKERQIAEQRAELSHQRLISTAAVLLLIVIFFTVYIISRRRAYNKLDASNRKLVLANERAEESSRMKTQFIQQISHEVRTPLNILTGFTQVLADPEIKLDDEELQSISKKMVENSDRITNLVNKMIELSETKSNADIECNDEVLALQIASEAVSASGVDEAGHLTFSMIVSPEVEQVSVHTNLRAAVRALSLVLDNARKFTAPAETRQHEQLTNHLQRVVLRISISSGRLFFSVEDTGIGIPHKEAERIFDEFVQLDEFYEGTGIGLAVARSLARRLGGDIVLDTAYIGGSRFVLTLPV